MGNIAKTIKKFRKERHLTQEEMSKRLNMARSTYSKLESGNTALRYELLRKISEIFNVRPEDIDKDDDSRFKSLAEKLEMMLFLSDHHFSEMLYKAVKYDDLTSKHKKVLQSKNLDNRIIYENTPLVGRIYEYGPKQVFGYMMTTLGMDVLFQENLIADEYWLTRWKNYLNKSDDEIEVDEFDYFEVCIFELIMPDGKEKLIQIATRDFPGEAAKTERRAINYLKNKTGAIKGSYIASTVEGYSPITEILK